MFSTTKDKDLSWKLIATLDGPEGNIAWNKRIGALPIYKSAEKDPFYADPKFKGWFEELADKDVVPTVMPTYLEEFAYLRRFDRGQDDAAGAARPDLAGGPGQAMGRLSDRRRSRSIWRRSKGATTHAGPDPASARSTMRFAGCPPRDLSRLS